MKGSFWAVSIFHFTLTFFHVSLISSHDSWGVTFSLLELGQVSCRSCHIATWNSAGGKKISYNCCCLDEHLNQDCLLEEVRQSRMSSFCLAFVLFSIFALRIFLPFLTIPHLGQRWHLIITVPLSPTFWLMPEISSISRNYFMQIITQ